MHSIPVWLLSSRVNSAENNMTIFHRPHQSSVAMSAVRRGLLRALHDVSTDSNHNATMTATNGTASNAATNAAANAAPPPSYDPHVFWGVNVFLALLLVSACLFWYKFHRSVLFGGSATAERRMQSDLIYARTVLERNRIKQERQQQSPEQRRAILLKSFERKAVSMVRSMETLLARLCLCICMVCSLCTFRYELLFDH
jgi:hypothetical protein